MQILIDPDATLDVAFDWSDWLTESETISSFTVTATTGVTITTPSPDETDGLITAWVTDGTPGSRPSVTCHVTTSAGRQDDRTIRLVVQDR